MSISVFNRDMPSKKYLCILYMIEPLKHDVYKFSECSATWYMSITIKRTSQLTTKMHYLTAEMRFIKSDCAIFSDASKLVGVGTLPPRSQNLIGDHNIITE